MAPTSDGMVWLGSGKTYQEMREIVDKYLDENGRLPQWDDKYEGEHWATIHTEATEDPRTDGNQQHEVGGNVSNDQRNTNGTRSTQNVAVEASSDGDEEDDDDSYNSSDDNF
ncbi:hypothetical protein ACA910_021761 [Epithemia clementina (nom. ined.)]